MYKKYLKSLSPLILLLLLSCSDHQSGNEIIFGISPEYPPFEFYDGDKMVGFDVDLAKMIAAKMNRHATLQPVSFSAILPSLNSGHIDAGISTITVTPERSINFDFSKPYYKGTLATTYLANHPFSGISVFNGKKVGCQLGTTMEIWAKKYIPNPSRLVLMDGNNQIIEGVKSGQIDYAILDTIQARSFVKKNNMLSYQIVAITNEGYAVALKKDSPLTEEISKAIESLQKDGSIQSLEKKWLE